MMSDANGELRPIHPYPPVGEGFDLAIGGVTKRFVLVSIGERVGFGAVRQALGMHGVIPESEWCDAFQRAYPESDGSGPIGVATVAGTDAFGRPVFRCIRGYAAGRFRWAGEGAYGAFWRWLMEVRA